VTVGIVAAGCAVGIILFSRVLSWLLKHYYHPTVAALVGFMVGSLWKVYPWKICTLEGVDRHGEAICLYDTNYLPQVDSSVMVAIVLMIVGFLLVSFLDHLQSGSNPLFSRFWRPRWIQAAAD
jgi:putative membrane protein